MGIGPEALARRCDADAIEEVDRLAVCLPTAHAPMLAERFHDLAADREDGVQAGHGILKDHRDLRAAQRAQRTRRKGENVLSVELDRPADDLAGLRHEPEKRTARDALSRARLADETECLAFVQIERDAIDGAHDPISRREYRHEISHREERSPGMHHGQRPPRIGGESVATSDPQPEAFAHALCQAVADQAEPDPDGDDHESRHRRDPPGVQEVVLAVGDHRTPLGGRWLDTEAEE